MNKSKVVFFYLITHTICITLFCVWYFIKDVYFGYELGDQLVILTILIFTFLSFLFLIIQKKINNFLLTIFITVAVFFDILMSYLIFKVLF